MAKFYKVLDEGDVVRVIIPARQRVVFVSTLPILMLVISFAVLWFTYQWLSAVSIFKQVISEVSAMLLLALEWFLTRKLLLELAVSRLTFERTTLSVVKSILRIPVSRRWYSCYRISLFTVTHDALNPDTIRLEFVYANKESVLLAASMPTQAFVQLGHLLRRKDFAFFRQDDTAAGQS